MYACRKACMAMARHGKWPCACLGEACRDMWPAMHASHDMCHEAMHAWPWCELGGGLYNGPIGWEERTHHPTQL
jgi:hypothetical protein